MLDGVAPNAQETTKAEGATNTEAVSQESAPKEGAEQSTPAQTTQTQEPPKGSEAKATTEQKPVVPEKYDLKLPEGSQLSAGRLEKIADFAKSQGFSTEQAQALVQQESEAVASYVSNQMEALNKQVDTWAEDVKHDKEIGGEAAKQNIELASRVAKRFGTDAFIKALNDTGLGNHPELVRTFVRIGKVMAEDRLILPGAQSSGAEPRAADILYGNSN